MAKSSIITNIVQQFGVFQIFSSNEHSQTALQSCVEATALNLLLKVSF